MKKILFLLVGITLAFQTYAQAPQAFKFQSVIRDASGMVLPLQDITLKFLIHVNAPDGEIIYAEQHLVSTNASGLANVDIGTGEIISGIFEGISWGDGTYFLEEQIDIGNTGDFQVFGTVQLLSVPYALHANTAGNGIQSMSTEERDALENPPVGMQIYNTTTNCLNYYSGSNWFETCGDCTPMPSQADAGINQSFSDETTATNLEGNTPELGIGTWNVASGTGGIFDDVNNPLTLFTGQPCESYILTWEISTSCGSTNDQMNIVFDAMATIAEAGEDVTITTEELSVALQANTPETGTGLWMVISGTGGLFEDATNPGTLFTGIPCETYLLRWSITTDCDETFDELTITFDATPTVAIAGDDIIIYNYDFTVSLAANTPQTGSGLWSIESGEGGVLEDATNPTTQFTALPCESYVLRWTIATPCHQSFDELTVEFDETPPTVNAGADIAICETNAPLLNGQAGNYASILWTSLGTGSFSNPEILNPVYIPSNEDIQTGTVELSLTAFPLTPCADSVFDSITLTIQQESIANAGEDAAICEAETFYNLNGLALNYSSVFWNTGGSGVFESPQQLNTKYYPSDEDALSGSVNLILTAQPISPCSVFAYDQMTLAIQQSPDIDAGDDATICEDQVLSLNGSASNYATVVWTSTGDGTFTFPDSLNTDYSPGEADKQTGVVSIVLSTSPISPCVDLESDTVILNIQPSPTAFAGEDASVCSNVTYTLSGEAENFTSVLWSTSGTGSFDNPYILSPSYSPGTQDILNGSVTLTLNAVASSPCTTAASAPMTLSFLPVPFVYAGEDQEDIAGTTTTLEGNNPASGSTGLWSIASGQGGNIAEQSNPQSEFTGLQGETYLLQWGITGQNGCINSDFVIVSFGIDPLSCPGMPTFTDTRDGKTYNTVLIGEQCWMKENLSYLPEVSPSSEGSETDPYYYVYDYQGTSVTEAKASDNYQNYGTLYNWPSSLDACPEGWHLPTDAEWTLLTDYLGGLDAAGGKMKSTRTDPDPHPHWNSPNTGAANSSGFSGLPGGLRGTNNTFYNLGNYGYFWSSTEYSPTTAWHRRLDYSNANAYRYFNTEGLGFSVRCLINMENNQHPDVPSTPNPENGTSNISTDINLSWSCSDPDNDPLTYDVYFGIEPTPPQVATGIANTFYTPGTLEYAKTYFWKIDAHDDQGNSTEGEVWSFTTMEEPWPCGDNFIDSRDGNEYSTVQIGEQCWMAENLAYLPEVSPPSQGNDTDPYYYVFGYQGYSVTEAKATENYQNYGALYNWPSSLDACPEGWHLPTDAEWTVLTDCLGGEDIAGGKMKSTRTEPDAHPRWSSPNTLATNSSGFSGLPGGYRSTSGPFGDLGNYGYFWSSTEYSTTNAWSRTLYSINDYVNRSSYTTKGLGFSVRCLRD